MTQTNMSLDEFKAWLTAHGGLLDSKFMDFVEFPVSEGGRGAIALNDIPQGKTLATIPRDITLSTRTCVLPSLFGSEWQTCNLNQGWTGLILCMMWETAQGASSKWFQYLNSLPTKFDTPMFWDESDLEELPPSVLEKLGKEDAERDYKDIIVPAIQSRQDLFPPALITQHYSLEQYHLMGSRILSRSFNVERWKNDEAMNVDESSDNDSQDDGSEDESEPDHDISMVPVADLLNARFECENAKLFYEKDHLKIVSTKDIRAGEQIWNTYGDLPNSELLRRYGHVDLLPLSNGQLGNPGDDVEVRADLVVAEISRSKGLSLQSMQERIDWWLDEGEDDILVIDFSMEVPPSLISLVRLLLLEEDEWFRARNSSKLPKPRLDSQGLSLIDNVLRAKLHQYKTTIEEDELLLVENPSPYKRSAIIVRLGEKRILQGCLQKVQQLAEQSADRDKKRKGNNDEAMSTAKKSRQ